jgi:hypothetical protein
LREIESVKHPKLRESANCERNSVVVNVLHTFFELQLDGLVVAAFGRGRWRAILTGEVGFDRARCRAAVAVIAVSVIALQLKQEPVPADLLAEADCVHEALDARAQGLAVPTCIELVIDFAHAVVFRQHAIRGRRTSQAGRRIQASEAGCVASLAIQRRRVVVLGRQRTLASVVRER